MDGIREWGYSLCAAAIACGMSPTNQTLAGKIRVWAKTAPAAAISAEYWLNQGKE